MFCACVYQSSANLVCFGCYVSSRSHGFHFVFFRFKNWNQMKKPETKKENWKKKKKKPKTLKKMCHYKDKTKIAKWNLWKKNLKKKEKKNTKQKFKKILCQFLATVEMLGNNKLFGGCHPKCCDHWLYILFLSAIFLLIFSQHADSKLWDWDNKVIMNYSNVLYVFLLIQHLKIQTSSKSKNAKFQSFSGNCIAYSAVKNWNMITVILRVIALIKQSSHLHT